MDEITRENVRQRIRDAMAKFGDQRAEQLYRAHIDLMSLAGELAYTKYETETKLVEFECEERVLFIEINDKFMGGTGKEREAKVFQDEAYVAKKKQLEEATSFARYLGKVQDHIAQFEESIRYKAASSTPQKTR